MMRRIAGTGLIFLLLVALATAQNYPKWSGPSTGIADYTGAQFSSVNPFPVTLTNSVTAVTKPPAFVGFGTLSVSNSSVGLLTLTVGPGSPAWSMPFAGTLYVKNSEASSGILFVCPLGGSCTTSNGIPLGQGAAYGFNLGTSVTSPTVIAVSTAIAVAQW